MLAVVAQGFVALALGTAGILLAIDYRGVSSRTAVETRRWWSAGAVRRRLSRGAVMSPRPFGVILALMAILILAGLVFRPGQ